MIVRAPYPDAGGGSSRLWTPQDMPADAKLGWWHFPDANTVTLDGNGKIASIENKFDNGSRPCSTAVVDKRHLYQDFNGFKTAFSDTTSYNGILLANTTGVPVGNANLCMIFVARSQDGVVGGFRGSGNYWVDNPFPDYRLRTNNGDFTGTGTTANDTMHTAIFNRANGTTMLRVDGSNRGTHAPSGGYNTTLPSFGIKGADEGFFPMKGNTLAGLLYKRDLTADEMYRHEWYYSPFTGMALPADSPYKTNPPMVPV